MDLNFRKLQMLTVDLDFRKIQMHIWGTNDSDDIFTKWIDGPCGPSAKLSWKDYVATEFPYYISDLPSQLPTMEEIIAAYGSEDDLAKDLPNATQVVKVRDYVIKTGTNTSILQEAENMLFLEKHCPGLKIPKVYAAYRVRQGCFHLITAHVPGRSLYPWIWDKLSHETRCNILRKLGEQVRLLRSVPSPEPQYYGRIYNQGFTRGEHPWLGFSGGQNRPWNGPYATHEEFAGQLLEVLLEHCTMQNHQYFSPGTKLYLESYNETMARAAGQNAVLTHADLGMHNVIMIPNPDDAEDPEICIVDWATMGWMPEYMELVKSDSCAPTSHSSEYMYELFKGSKHGYLDTANYIGKLSNEASMGF